MKHSAFFDRSSTFLSTANTASTETSNSCFVRVLRAILLTLRTRWSFPSHKIIEFFPGLQCLGRPYPYSWNRPDEQRHEYLQLEYAEIWLGDSVLPFAVKPILFVCILVKVASDNRGRWHGRKHREYAKADDESFEFIRLTFRTSVSLNGGADAKQRHKSSD